MPVWILAVTVQRYLVLLGEDNMKYMYTQWGTNGGQAAATKSNYWMISVKKYFSQKQLWGRGCSFCLEVLKAEVRRHVMSWSCCDPINNPCVQNYTTQAANSDCDTCVCLITYRARNTSEPRIKLPSVPAGTYSGKSSSWFSSTNSRADLAEAICLRKTDMVSIIQMEPSILAYRQTK